MSQKNKIILLGGIILIAVILIWGLQVYKEKGYQQSFNSEKLYRECLSRLRESQTAVKGEAIPLGAICKLERGKVKLLPKSNSQIRPGDVVVSIVDTSKIFTEKYFRSRHYVLTSRQKDDLSKGIVKFCVSYGPYSAKRPLTLLPNIFQAPQVLNKTAMACQTFPNKTYLRPIGVVGIIPRNGRGKPFGLSILLPNTGVNSYFTLYQHFVRIK